MVNYNKLNSRNSFRAYERKLDLDKVQSALDKIRETKLLEQEEILNKTKVQPNDPRLVKKEKASNKFTETYKFINDEVEKYFKESFKNIIIKSNILDKDLVINNSVSIFKTTNELLENLLSDINIKNLYNSELGSILYESLLEKIELEYNSEEPVKDINNKISIIENTYAEILHENVVNMIVNEKERKNKLSVLEEKIQENKNIKPKDKRDLKNTSLLEALLIFNSKIKKNEVLNESEELEKSNFCLSESIMQYSFLETLKIMNLLNIDETKFIDKLKHYKIK